MGDVPSLEDRDEQVALLCALLPRLRRMHRGPVGAAKRLVIDRAVRAARAGEPLDGYLSELGLLRPPQPPDPGGARSTTLPPAVDGAGPRTLPGAYVCPRAVCARREHRRVDEEVPVCEVFDLALRFDAES